MCEVKDDCLPQPDGLSTVLNMTRLPPLHTARRAKQSHSVGQLSQYTFGTV